LKVVMRSWLLLLVSAAGLAQAQAPARVEIVYEISRNGSPMAEVVELLEQSGGRYRLTETWKGLGLYALLGSARRSSQGTVVASGLRPEEFFDERTGRDTARAWFDWKTSTLSMQHGGPRRSEPLPPNAQDRLSFFFALSFLPGRAQSIRYTIADGKGMSRHEYVVAGRERVTVPAGEFDAVKVLRHTDRKNAAQIWLATERWHLPVRLYAEDRDGARYDQVATRITTP
jgi:uncharacterized protein DUF3108